MKYKVRVSELRYGEVEVEAASEQEAKTKATGMAIDFFDSEITDITAEKIVQNDPKSVIERLEKWVNGDNCDNCTARNDTVFWAIELLRKAYLAEEVPCAYIVTELCPHCMSEVEMVWNTEVDGFKAVCPHCGKQLTLCDECRHSGTGNCDYDKTTDSCRHNKSAETAGRKLWMRLGVTLHITDSEASAIMGEDKHNSTLTLRSILCAGRFEPDGDSYIPGESIVSYNADYKTKYDDGDIDFNL